MFWQACVWGLGVSLGASVGLMVFVVAVTLWKMTTESQVVKQMRDVNEASLAALLRRNELSEEQVDCLRRIAAATERE